MERIQESREAREIVPQWIRPDLQNERGEIERVIRDFLSEDPNEKTITNIIAILEGSPLIDLSDEEWSLVENTDSFHGVRAGHVEDAEQLTEGYNQELKAENKRDFNGLLNSFKQGRDIEAPTILKSKGILHLVSGNTRLKIARGLNSRPKVIIGQLT
jgi:hypothetical protein